MTISIILMQPEHPGNVGAIARVMKNFGFLDLVIIDPICDVKSDEAIRRSKHAKDVLLKARILKRLPKVDYLVATSAKIGSDYNLNRSPINPEKFANKVKGLNKSKIGVLIGRESDGLYNHEIEKCDFIITIPTNNNYSTLNISHSVSVICYELFKVTGKSNSEQLNQISSVEKKQILKMFNIVFNKLKFSTIDKKKTQKTLWRRIIGKSFLTKRESFALMGFLRKLMEQL